MRQYFALLDQLAGLRAALRQLLNDPKVALPFLQPGACTARPCVQRKRGRAATRHAVMCWV